MRLVASCVTALSKIIFSQNQGKEFFFEKIPHLPPEYQIDRA